MPDQGQINFTIAAHNRASGAIAGVNKSLGGLQAKTIAVGSAIGAALGGLAVQAFSKMTDFVKDSIGAASNLNETMSKTQVIFGSAADDVIAFAKQAGDSLGLSQQAALDASSTFAVFAQSAGLGGKDLSKFSGDLVTLSADFASFYNTSPEQAITAIGAALRGESEPIRKYNILLNDMTLRQRAVTLGITKTTKKALTPQQKVLAAQAEIIAQSSVAQGDFARTSGGLANQQRILSAAMSNLSADLGTAFMPILAELMGFITGTVIPTFRNNFVPIIEKLKEVFEGVAKTVKGAVQPIMEALQPVIDKIAWNFMVLQGRLSEVWDAVKWKLMVAFSNLTAFMRDEVGPAISKFVELLNGPLGTALFVLGGAIAGIKIALFAYQTAITAVTAVKGAWAAITGTVTAAQALLNAVMAMNPIALVVLAIAALIGALIAAYMASEDFRNIVDGLFKLLGDVAGFIGGALTTAFDAFGKFISDLGAFIMESPFGDFLRFVSAVAGGIGDIIGAVFGGGNNSPVAATGGGGGATYTGIGGGGLAPTVNTYVTLDGKQVADSVDVRLGRSYGSGSVPRTAPGGGY